MLWTGNAGVLRHTGIFGMDDSAGQERETFKHIFCSTHKERAKHETEGFGRFQRKAAETAAGYGLGKAGSAPNSFWDRVHLSEEAFFAREEKEKESEKLACCCINGKEGQGGASCAHK